MALKVNLKEVHVLTLSFGLQNCSKLRNLDMPEALGTIWVQCRQHLVIDTSAAATAIKMTSGFFLIGGFKFVIKAKCFRTAFKMPIQLLSVEHMLIQFSPDMVVYDKCYQIS